MRKDSRPQAVFSTAHFLVDLCCIFLETAYLLPGAGDRRAWLWCVLVYNFFAFACQLPAGIFGDRQNKPWILAGSGCFLIAAAYLMTAFCLKAGAWSLPGAGQFPVSSASGAAASLPLLLLISAAAGIGNSCFHVGGGIDLLRRSGGKAAIPGIFVSTGAFGVWLGPVLAAKQSARAFGLFSGCALMILTGFILIRSHFLRKKRAEEDDADWKAGAARDTVPGRASAGRGAALSAAICLFTAVLFRSYAGTIMRYGWKKAFLAFLFTVGIVFGKMLGGIIGDRAGWRRTAVMSLAVSGLLFLTADRHPVCGIAAVFFFNMTMPLTLSALALLHPGREGMAFGLTTLALFLGTLPSLMESAGLLHSGGSSLLPAVCVVSLVLMAAGLKQEDRGEIL